MHHHNFHVWRTKTKLMQSHLQTKVGVKGEGDFTTMIRNKNIIHNYLSSIFEVHLF